MGTPLVANVNYLMTPNRPRRPTVPSHTRVVPTRFTSEGVHVPTVPGTRYNMVLPASQAEMDGHQRFQRGDMTGAARCYSEALQQAPNPFVRRCTAAVMASVGDLHGAFEQTALMVQMEPHNKKARFLNKAVCDVINAVSAAKPVSGSQVTTVAGLLTPQQLKANAYRFRMTSHPTLPRSNAPSDEVKIARTHRIHPQLIKSLKKSLPVGMDATQFGTPGRGFWEKNGVESRAIHAAAASEKCSPVPGSANRWVDPGMPAVSGMELASFHREMSGPIGGCH